MSKVNPLYILTFLVILLIFSISKVNYSKEQLKSLKDEYTNIENIANELYVLKKIYADKRSIKHQIESILRNRALSDANIEKVYKKSSIVISSDAISLKGLNFLVGKIVNKTFNIKKLKIKKISKKSATLLMEIAW